MTAKSALAAIVFGFLSTAHVHATIWTYQWTSADPLFGDNGGGIWRQITFTQDDTSGLFTGSISLDITDDTTRSLWLSVTNGPTPDAVSADWAGLYLHEGTLYARPYDQSPVADHQLSNIILTSSYSVSDVGSIRTYDFSVDTNAINSWAGAPVGWHGFGFPYDAQHQTAGDAFQPYRMGAWVRSFADDSVEIGGSTDIGSAGLWDVTWGQPEDLNIGTWDIGNTAVVPEPSSLILLASLGSLLVCGHRRRFLTVNG